MELTEILIFAIKASIVLIVFGLGLNSTWHDVFSPFRSPGLLLRSLLSMIVVMPMVAAAFVVAFNLPPAVKVALVALAVSPVPPLLPGKELRAGGRSSYAVGLFSVIAAISIITVPLTVALFARAFHRTADISPLAVAGPVLMSVLLPLAAGIFLRQWLPGPAGKAARPIALLGIVLLAAGMLPMLLGLWTAIREFIGNGTALIVGATAAVGLGVGHLLGGPQADTRTVLALSTASRHPAVALTVAVASGEQMKSALGAVLLYAVMAAIVSMPYVMWRKRLAGVPSPSQAARL